MENSAEISFRDYYRTLQLSDKGYFLLLITIFVPLTFKLISPFFILCGLGGYTDIIMPTLFWIGVCLSFKRIVPYITTKNVVAYLLFSFFFFISQFIYPNTAQDVNDNFISFILKVVPYFFIGLTLDYDRDNKLYYYTAVFGVLVQLFWQFCLIVGLAEYDIDDRTSSEQMNTAYGFLFSLTYVTIITFRHRNPFNIVLSILGVVMLLLMGTRGPVVVFVVGILSYILFALQFKSNNNIKKIIITALALVFYVFLQPVMTALSVLSTTLGLSSRVFDSILEGTMVDINDSSYRDLIYNSAINAIKNDPTGFGYGFCFNQSHLVNYTYVHNFELEILLDFGRIGGTIILGLILFFILKTYFRVRSTDESAFFFVMLVSGLLSLQFSKTWLEFPLFFVFIGYIVSVLRVKSTKKELSYEQG